MIHIDQGRPEHLGKLVRALLPEHPDLDVFTDVRAVTRVEPGSVLILVPKPEDADWLNLNRPIFSQRKLAVVLYCDRQTTLALADRAVDFFDWVSQHHTCPDAPPDFAVQGFRKAVANNAPGIVWTGSVEGLVRVFEAACPGETLRWVVPASDYMEIERAIRGVGDAWVACRIRTKKHLLLFRRALARVRKGPRAIVLMNVPESPGWWRVNDTCMVLEEARSIFQHTGICRPGRLAALTGLEPETVELAGKLLQEGIDETDLIATLINNADPGVALAKQAQALGLVELRAVAFRIAPAPLSRALDDAPDVQVWRDARWQTVEDQLKQETDVRLAEIGFWVAMDKDFSKFVTTENRKFWDGGNREFLLEGLYARLGLFEVTSSPRSLSDSIHERMPAQIPDWEANYIAESRQTRLKSIQVDVRSALDLSKNPYSPYRIGGAIETEGSLNGPSTLFFAECMLDMALLLHRKGDAATAFALLRKLLATEWASLQVEASGAGEPSAKPTSSTSVNDFIHLFLAPSNSPPPLPPESRARALRILADVLLSQGRYEEAEDVAQKAHETALHAPEIALPETWRALALCGRARVLQGRADEGKKDLLDAIEMATKNFGQTHAEVARLWLDLGRSHGRNHDGDTAETLRKVIAIWEHAQCDAKERADALEELRRISE